MKIFMNGGKVNFVDENNVLLGYDMDQCCCEHAGWFISSVEEPDALEEATYKLENARNMEDGQTGTVIDMPGWMFVANQKLVKSFISPSEEIDDGAIVSAKIEKDGEFKYIHLFNAHNGYYAHGFNFRDEEGCI